MTIELSKLRGQGFIVLGMGDFNSRIGRIHGLEENTPDINKKGQMYINFVTQANVVILNTLSHPALSFYDLFSDYVIYEQA